LRNAKVKAKEKLREFRGKRKHFWNIRKTKL
jgi:hypothetical protein